MPSVKKEDEIGRNSRVSAATLDLSGRKLRWIEPLPDGMSPQTILYNNNDISKVQNLQYFAHLQQLSLADNHLVEMVGISQAQGLKVLDLSNNSIITIKELTHLRCLEWLNLSGNSVKKIQNLEKNINLQHLDLSDNSIIRISNLKNLTKLKVLLLHGNLISSLRNFEENVSESSISTLSLAENEISDLNEILYLKSLTSLEQLSINGNPCVLALSSVTGFNYRPFIVFTCPRLRNLDGQLISQGDRLESERLKIDRQLHTFSPGHHPQLVTYLSHATPLRPSSAKTPTPNIDSVSCDVLMSDEQDEQDRWSVPVLDDKPSTDAKDLELEDVSECDDQLESESCYIPVDSPLLLPHEDEGSEDWYMSHSQGNQGYTSRDARHDEEKRSHVGLPVETILCGEVTLNNADGNRNDDAIMTEEEAFGLINLAATIIQAHVRGFLVRRRMLNFYEYRHKNRAATRIQAGWKGYKTRTYNAKVVRARNEIRARRLTSHINHLASLVVRCQEQAAKDKRTMAKAIKCLWSELEKQNNRNVARLSREQNSAALQIQRSWRAYRVRMTYPRLTYTSLTSYQSVAMVCQNLQKQVDLLKTEITDLKTERNNRENLECTNKDTGTCKVNDVRPRSIPEIRVIRPSICILPEMVPIMSETKDPISIDEHVEEILSDDDSHVEIEPLDLGKYDDYGDDDGSNDDGDDDDDDAGADGHGSGADGHDDGHDAGADGHDAGADAGADGNGDNSYDAGAGADGHDAGADGHDAGADGHDACADGHDAGADGNGDNSYDAGADGYDAGADGYGAGADGYGAGADDDDDNKGDKNFGDATFSFEKSGPENKDDYATVDFEFGRKDNFQDEDSDMYQEEFSESNSTFIKQHTSNTTHVIFQDGTGQKVDQRTSSSVCNKGNGVCSEEETESHSTEERELIFSTKEELNSVHDFESSSLSGNKEFVQVCTETSENFSTQNKDEISGTLDADLSQSLSDISSNIGVYGNGDLENQHNKCARINGECNEIEDGSKVKTAKETIPSTQTVLDYTEMTSEEIKSDPSSEHETAKEGGSETDLSISARTESSLSGDATDLSMSDSSPSVSPRPEDLACRRKKKFLLRSSSADTMPRIRALHSSHSMDSDDLSSSLNFSTRLSQRAAALLLELRSDIASLTARQFSESDSDYFESRATAESHVITDQTSRDAGPGSSAPSNISTTTGVSNQPKKYFTSLLSKIPLEIKPGVNVETMDRTMDKSEDVKELVHSDVGESSDETGGDTGDIRGLKGSPIQEEQGGTVLPHKAVLDKPGNAGTDSQGKRPPLMHMTFTMPVFEDIERESFSMEDYMEDSST